MQYLMISSRYKEVYVIINLVSVNYNVNIRFRDMIGATMSGKLIPKVILSFAVLYHILWAMLCKN